MNHLDLQINLLSEQENSHILRMLQAIQRKLQIDDDPEAQTLQENAEPEQLVRQIKSTIEKAPAAQ